jgi:hypothetical protein
MLHVIPQSLLASYHSLRVWQQQMQWWLCRCNGDDADDSDWCGCVYGSEDSYWWLCDWCACCDDAVVVADDDSDDEATGGWKTGENDVLYRAQTIAGRGLYQEGDRIDDAYPSSPPLSDEQEVVTQSQQPQQPQRQPYCLAKDYNPELEFYRNYGQVEDRRLDFSLTTAMSVVTLEAEQLLEENYDALPLAVEADEEGASRQQRRKSRKQRPVNELNMRRALRRYHNAIGYETDLTRKRQMIDKYETYKAFYDEENAEDQEEAHFQLRVARSQEGTLYPPERRTSARSPTRTICRRKQRFASSTDATVSVCGAAARQRQARLKPCKNRMNNFIV